MTQAHPILIIEDDAVLGGAVLQRLRLEGHEVVWAQTCGQALDLIRRRRFRFVLADIRLPDGSGEDLHRQALPHLGTTPIVFATAFGDVDQAVRLVRAGADDYLTKPYDLDDLVLRIERASARAADPPAGDAPDALGVAAPSQALAAALSRVASSPLPVLLRGETGTGKELAARMLHDRSPRAGQPFVAVNCGAMARDLGESQFFGHEKGAFTGASTAHAGYFEEAGEGTLFLDEIGELEAPLQSLLLRVLQDGNYRRLGSSRTQAFKGRLVAATNADLDARMASGAFREDLYYRLAVVELHVPPLRERPEDILHLAGRFLAQSGTGTAAPLALAPAAEAAILAHPWPGNVRELRNRIQRAAVLARGETIVPADLFPERSLDDVPRLGLEQARRQAETDEIERVLALTGGRLGEAAKRLGISRTTLWKRMKKSPGR